MKRALWTIAFLFCSLPFCLDQGSLASAQAPKPAPKPAAPRTARPAAPAAPAPAAPAPAAPQPRRIVRSDTVNETSVGEFDNSRRVAIVAAVGKYDDPGLAALRFTIADAYELSAELRRQGYIVHTLLNQEATNDNIRERFESVGAGGDKPGTLLFAFAGHGFQSEKGINYLATYSTTIDSLEQRGLSLPEVQALMKATGAKRSVLLVDACRNIPGARAVGTTTTFRDLEKSEGVRTLLSTRPGGFSFEDQALQHGIFTHFVIEGLRGKAANTDGKVTFDDLAGFVEKRVEGYASERGLSQKPFRAVDASGDFLLSTAVALKDEEITQIRDQSGSKNMPNDAVSVARQGDGFLAQNYVMVAQDDELRLYSSPGMQLFASLALDTQTKDVPAGSKRYVGSAGRGDQIMHAVVRFDGGLPVELKGRVGTTCQAPARCTGQDIRLPGESASANSLVQRGNPAAQAGARILGGLGRGRAAQRVEQATQVAATTIQAIEGRSWEAFNLAPGLKSAAR